jgi:acyl carrier protein
MATSTEIGHLDVVVEEFRTVFKSKGMVPPAMTADTILDGSLGLESLDFAEVVMRLEQVFGFDPFSGDKIPEVNTLADFCVLYQNLNG